MTLLKLYSEIPVEFPIDQRIVRRGNVMHHEFNEGDTVKCVWCGESITLDSNTVFRYRHPIDVNPRVSCKSCGNVADIAYYCNKDNRVRIKPWDADHVKTEFDPVEGEVALC